MNNTLQILNIDYLYLDLMSCKRCLDTNLNLDNAISKVLHLLGDKIITFNVNKVHINNEDKAREFGLEVSPTIRINGEDIQSDWIDNQCTECGDLCECAQHITCRLWKWDGNEFLAAPENLILDAILKNVYSEKTSVIDDKSSMKELNTNIKTFFAEKHNEANLKNNSCC